MPATQLVQLAAPALLVLPGAHTAHEVAPVDAAKLPAGQLEHAARPAVSAYLPAAQLAQIVAPVPLVLPGAQAAHEVAPVDEA